MTITRSAAVGTARARGTRGRVIVWGLLGHSPFGGMTWQVLNHLVGLEQLGYDVWYVEDSDEPTFNLDIDTLTEEYDDNIDYISRYLGSIGMGDRWAFRLPSTETVVGNLGWNGLQALYRSADVVLNLCGSHELMAHHDDIRHLVYVETDPGAAQVALAEGREPLASELMRYDLIATYATNLGAPNCDLPPLTARWCATHPPVAIDLWHTRSAPTNEALTTVMNWATPDGAIEWQGRLWRWSKRPAFERIIPLPGSVPVPLEVAMRLAPDGVMDELATAGWRLTSAEDLDRPGAYRRYIRTSAGEFSIAKEQYVAPRSGWISDRTVCYLAAGRPAVVESTGIRGVPLGEGLLEFSTIDDAARAVTEVSARYSKHATAAEDIARQYFDARHVLDRLLSHL